MSSAKQAFCWIMCSSCVLVLCPLHIWHGFNLPREVNMIFNKKFIDIYINCLLCCDEDNRGTEMSKTRSLP